MPSRWMTSFWVLCAFCGASSAADWLLAKAYKLPSEYTNQESGYFSIIEGHNGKLYIGCAKYGVDAYLLEFDPKTEKTRMVMDVHEVIGSKATGFAAQAKIHTRNNIGESGKIYFGTKQGYPKEGEKRSDYSGGHPIVYDPATGKSRVYGIPIPHQGVISIAPDESRGVAYISTCSDERPVKPRGSRTAAKSTLANAGSDFNLEINSADPSPAPSLMLSVTACLCCRTSS